MRIFSNSRLIQWFLPSWVEAITFPWGIHFRKNPTQRLMRHETKHFEQIQKDGILTFYSRYIWEYIQNLFKYKDMRLAYMAISYEREARRAERMV